MEKGIKDYIKIFIIIGIIFAIFISIYIIYNSYVNKKDDYKIAEKYEVNEVLPVYITEDQMAKIYLADFKSYLYSKLDEAYNLLNKEYRETKFGSVQNFKNYINSIELSTISVKSFAIKNSGGYEYFYIYDNNDRLYIFKTKGVMQYEVYLDETTVSI